ncbi:ParA family protein [Zhenpiania hominis]|uniref:Sporulation initiation inhibitor protein Soj n=1 Tax=Zhenpiania hominis TaxID=2763644 RepID=A0A923NJ58_9FIRM|nr:ParA family protein [Zhenpiania hominis]MBC6678257.1 ParA family protein [Zhenpiania hominis]
MGKVIAICNHKGGVGKTTTTLNMAAQMATMGKRVLVLDFDGQANLTLACGIEDFEKLDATIAGVLDDLIQEGETERPMPIYQVQECLELIPANTALAATNQELIKAIAREWVLHTALEPIRNQYDYILIDCAPSLGIDLLNALVAADEVLIVTNPARFSERGTHQLLRTIKMVQKLLNKELTIAGSLFNRVDRRTRLARDIMALMRENWGTELHLFDTEIPNSIRIDESQAMGVPLIMYQPESKPAKAYQEFVREYLQGEER